MPRSKKREAQPESEDIFGFSQQKRPAKRKKSADKDVIDDNSLFGTLVNKCGAILRKGKPNMLNCDQAIFQQNLKRSLKTHSPLSLEKTIEEFVKGFEQFIEDFDRFKWSLLYCQTSTTCEDARGSQQDSLIRLMLNIDELQSKIISLLTEKFFIVIYDNSLNQEVDFPRLILGSFRWLDHIVDQDVLTAKIKDLLDASPVEVQKEIIGFIPDILDDASHEGISLTLFELYDTTPDLTSAILDTLSCMNLPQKTLSDIHHKVLKALHAVKGPNLAIVVNFLLHHTTQSLAPQILSDIREKINLPGDTAASLTLSQNILHKRSPKASQNQNQSKIKEYSAYEILVFEKIKSSMLIFRYLAVAWLKVINDVTDMEEIRPFDLLMLIMLYDVVPSRRKSIESIFRNKIRAGLPSDPFLKKLFSNHSSFLKEYFDALQKITVILTRSSEPNICHYGIALYRYSFLSLESNRRETITTMLTHLRDNASIKLATLSLLSELAHKHTKLMIKYTMFLKAAIDVIHLLNVREAKKLMGAIIHLAHAEKHSPLESELAILVKKQLSHTDIKFKRLGVLSAVLTMKNINLDNNNMTDNSDTSEPDENSPLGQQKELFQMVSKCTRASPSACALFYDELASNILKEGFNSKFMEVICEKMQMKFESNFILDLNEEEMEKNTLLPVSLQYGFQEDDEQIYVVNLAPMLFQALSKKATEDLTPSEFSVSVMAPHFRLLRMIVSRVNEGSLDNIDGLLFYSVVSPDPSTYEKFSSLSGDQQQAALSFLFYLVNWFREIVNAFAMQKDSEIKIKVIKRLRQIVDLQALLSKLLPLCPSYVPPPAVFDYDLSVPVKKMLAAPTESKAKKSTSKKGGKKGKKGAEINPTPLSPSKTPNLVSQVDLPSTNPSTQSKTKSLGSIDMTPFRPHFRELHLDVFNLLFRAPSFDTNISENSGALTIPEAEFLLNDLNAKLSRAFDSGTKRTSVLGKSSVERDVGFSYLDLFDYNALAGQTHRFIKPICFHLEKISEYFQTMISDNDGVEDAPSIYTESTSPIMKVNTMLFTTLKIFFSCPNLQFPEHEHHLTAALKIIVKKIESDPTQMGKESLIKTAFKYISKYQDSILNIETAVSQIQALQAFVSLSQDPTPLKVKLVKDIERILQKEWYTLGGNKEKGSSFARHIETLLAIFFLHSNSQLETILNFTSQGTKDLTKGKEHSDAFPTLNKTTLLVYYKSLFENLVKGVRKELSACSNLSEESANQKKLTVWHSSIKIFSELVNILKAFASSTMLSTCIKNSKGFLDLFISQAMPILDKCLHSDQQDVVVLIKNLQTTTRMLHNACTHSKVKQDLKLMKYVPFLKKCLESIIYRVKAMLINNEASDAFWMGNLKNRDLQGEEILTQRVSKDESDEEQEEVEGEESDVDLDEENESSSLKGRSTTDYDDTV